jgi:hypothetical protein
MSASRPFAYNTGSPITGTEQVGDIAIGWPTSGFESTGLEWWNGPDEELGYVICKPIPLDNQSTPVPGDNLILSTTYKGVDINLSNGNQTASQQFGYQMSVLGETLISGSDKVMFSIKSTSLEPLTLPQSRFIGVGNTSMNYQGSPYGGYPGNDTNSIGFNAIGEYYYNGSVVTYGLPTWTQGDVIDIAISHGQYWWIRVNGGNWNNNPSANPTTVDYGLPLNGLTNYYPVLCPSYEGTMEILNIPKYGYPEGYNFLGKTTASIGFSRTNGFDDNEFIAMAENLIIGSSFANAVEASDALTTNGFWNSYISPVLYLDAGNLSSYPGTGTVWTDLIGGKTFNLINGPVYLSFVNGGTMRFNAGFSQYAECSTSLPDLNTWSVGVWHNYNGTNTGGNPCILTEIYPGSSGQINYSLGDNDGGFSSGFFDGGWRVTYCYTLTPHNWYFIVGTYDGTTVKLYVNNTLVDSTSYTGTPISSQGGIRLMRRWDLPEYWGGFLSIVGIYDKALNTSQIESIWNLNKARFGL